jgi:cell division protein FtsN
MGHRDLKNSSRASRAQTTRSQGGGGGVMMGVIIGLIVGVAAVVGAVMYFSRAATPFANMQKMERSASQAAPGAQPQLMAPGLSIGESGSSAPVTDVPAAPSAHPASAPVAKGAAAKGKPAAAGTAAPSADKDGQRFDFYKILPGKVDAVTPNDQPASSASGSTKKPAYLQLGAFQNQDDADNLKAKLALIGMEATIQSVTVAGKGMLHRVRVGPFQRQDEIDRARAQLKQNGISTAIKAN